MATGTNLIPTTQKTLRKGALSKDIIEVAEKDYLTLLRGIAKQDTAQQIALGNTPSNIIVDGKDSRNIDAAKFSVRVLFVDTKAMIAALTAAYNMLQDIGAENTGYTKSQYKIYQSNKRGEAPKYVADSPGGVNTANFNSDTVLIVAGPFVPWTRKYRFWTRQGVELKTRMRRGKKFAGMAKETRPRVQLDIYQTVAQKVRRQYPFLLVKEWWIKTDNLSPGRPTAVDRVGGVAVLLNKRGRV